MKKKLTLLLFGLLLAVGWTNAFAQQQATVSPAERLSLTVVDNQSVYDVAAQTNTYTNTLQLSQPTGDNKLTAGMLNNGDNFIIVSRQGDTESAPTECARINLKAEFSSQEMEEVSTIYTLVETTPSSEYAFTPDDPTWSATSCVMQTNGTVYIQNGGSLTFTIPEGYEDAAFLVAMYAGSNLRGYYFAVNNIVVNVTQSGWVTHLASGLSSGDQIVIDGAIKSGSNYYTYDSPDLLAVEILYVPPMTPEITVTPYIGENAGSALTYSPNDILDMSSFGTITDQFTQSTQNDNYPNSYSYKAEMEANVEWPSTGVTTDFYASVDFTAGDGDDLGSCEYIGPNNWGYNLAVMYYTPNGGLPSMYLIDASDMIYTMPPSFSGNTVNVTVTSTNHSYGSGDLMVNGVNHTFTQGSSYTWTVPVMAGGVIPFRLAPDNEDGYTCDIAKIVIQSGNGNAMNAPQPKSVAPIQQQIDKRFTVNMNKDKSQIKKMSVKK